MPFHSGIGSSSSRGAASILAVLALAAVACSGEATTNDDDPASAGAGGGAGEGSEPPEPECETSFGPIDPTALIDDLEDGNPLVAPVATRNGSWWLTTDLSPMPPASIEPVADAAPPPERILGGRCESEFAMRITGQGFTSWGVSLSAGFRYTTDVAPIDASSFRGVMFWARVGETHNSPVRVQFQDSNTHPVGGICNAEPDAIDSCYNGFGTELLPLDTSWRLYKLDFSRMTQRDFGYIAESFDTSAVFDIEWSVLPNTVFDLWVDDVWFYE